MQPAAHACMRCIHTMHMNMMEVEMSKIFLLPTLSTTKMEAIVPTNDIRPMISVE